MNLNEEYRRHIETLAREALATFGKVSEAAKRRLLEDEGIGVDALAAVNTMTAGAAAQRLNQISDENRAGFQVLASEPAIARVVAENPDGEQRVYYICRAAPPPGVVRGLARR